MSPVEIVMLGTPADRLLLAAGFFLSPLIAILQQPRWPKWFKSVVTALICTLLGVGRAYLKGGLATLADGRAFDAVIILLIEVYVLYLGLWKHIGAKGIEQFTSGQGPFWDAIRQLRSGNTATGVGGAPSRERDLTATVASMAWDQAAPVVAAHLPKVMPFVDTPAEGDPDEEAAGAQERMGRGNQ